MYQSTENAALTMRWMLETDSSGRTRLVAHWAPPQSAAVTQHTQAVHAA